MNRLIQLAVESNLIKWDVLPSGIRSPDHESVAEVARFAELIVRECAKVSERTGALNEADFEGEMIADALKEHFGVK